MKVWELEEGEEYVAYDKNFGKRNYKIVEGEFLYFDDNERWSLSLRKFKELNELDFTLYTPPTDWSKVKVDTKVLVRDYDDEVWTRRHFAKYENGTIYVYSVGTTSFTTDMFLSSYNQAKLYTE